MMIFRLGAAEAGGNDSFAGGPHLATVEECIWFARQVDYVLGYVCEDRNTMFSLHLDTEWFVDLLKGMSTKREIFAHVIENVSQVSGRIAEIDHSELAIGGYVDHGNMMAVAQVLRYARSADEVYGYIQFNRQGGYLYPMTADRVEMFLDEEQEGVAAKSKRVFAYYYDHPNRTVLRIGGEE